ncbi:MAG: class I SAM-dependent methyltransferase [Colwellia sp.]|nr:class I SAM-dependent methyltransferase [Colwellia sp.]
MALEQVNPIEKFNNKVIQEYNLILKEMKDEDWFIFMNHGYAPCNIELKESDQKWHHQISLYNNLFIQAQKFGLSKSLVNKSILEVGCGRGGGLSFIKNYYNPKEAIGLDLNANQVSFCQKNHQREGLKYVIGDSCALQFDDNYFDVITNVESSHCYSNIYKFYSEVSRTLKSGGYFLYTDVFSPDETLYKQILNLQNDLLPNMELLYAHDMTKNVIEACEIDKINFKKTFPDKKFEFLADISLQKEELYLSGKLKYLTVIARKT